MNTSTTATTEVTLLSLPRLAQCCFRAVYHHAPPQGLLPLLFPSFLTVLSSSSPILLHPTPVSYSDSYSLRPSLPRVPITAAPSWSHDNIND